MIRTVVNSSRKEMTLISCKSMLSSYNSEKVVLVMISLERVTGSRLVEDKMLSSIKGATNKWFKEEISTVIDNTTDKRASPCKNKSVLWQLMSVMHCAVDSHYFLTASSELKSCFVRFDPYGRQCSSWMPHGRGGSRWVQFWTTAPQTSVTPQFMVPLSYKCALFWSLSR